LNVESRKQSISATLIQIKEKINLIAITPAPADSVYIAERDSLLNVLLDLQEGVYLLQESLNNSRSLTADQLIIQNDATSASAVFEINRKQINKVWLETLAKGIYEFDASQLGTIESIAGQCPLSGGNAVFKARGLMSIVKDTIFYDDNLCNNSYGNRLAGQEEQSNFVLLFPNPASDQLTLEFEEAIEVEYELILYSVTGQRYARYMLSERQKSFTVDIGTIPSGLYFYEIRDNEKNIASGKLTIMKL
jgi:hypothetical protein